MEPLEIGDIRVTPVNDGESRFPAHTYFQGSTAADWESHRDMIDDDGNYIFPLGCFVIDAPGRRILVDTGLGPVDVGFARGGDLPAGLQAEEIAPDSIELVLLTHFHADHVGGVTTEDALNFANAEIAMTQVEHTYWSEDPPQNTFVRSDVLDAISGRVSFVEDGASLAPGVDVISLPGHTPGSAGLVISSGSARAMLLGDAIACPVQLEEAEWTSMGDIDPKLSKRTREALWREIEGTETLVGAAHFPGLQFGRVLVGEGKRYFG